MSRTVLRGAYVLQGAGLTFERRPLDVVIEGERIAAVEPANSVAGADHVVDLSRRLLVPGLGFALWLDGAQANFRDLLVVFALGLVVPGMVVHLAKALATRLRDHREWASLPLDGTSV